MKLFTTLLIALLAGFLVYAARQRIKLALSVAVVVYLVVLPIRLLFSAGEIARRIDELIWPAFFILVIWSALWWVSTRYQQRKERKRAASRLRQ